MKDEKKHDGLLPTDNMTRKCTTQIGALSTINEFDTIFKIYTDKKNAKQYKQIDKRLIFSTASDTQDNDSKFILRIVSSKGEHKIN